ncbi:CidA/LrgA family protein [Antarcticirhabdus aurantiaca]|uniref:CidA/LrgA family protein n=1 Tax=Antarcticirhabdus aurantiaca TaxID=2606717 RepID=A0ACD4NHF8_9HYPH|nr:CidA/LrgA family protein [Antarcticirhabdus aurantiaca]WAJ26225.1 CidA/LrgA family protein [Jeongeuplla avenae]
MLPALTAILLCQLAGETIAAATGLPLPGPVIGMAILFLVLLLRGSVPTDLGQVGGALLANLSLLFVPAGVGIMTHAARLEAEALPLGATLVLSTLATIAVTGLVMNRLGRTGRRTDG